MAFYEKLKGEGAPLPPRPSLKVLGLAWLGGFLAIAVLALLSANLSVTLMLGSFGASCVLIFGFPDAPFSQPRNVVVGHVLSSFTGLATLAIFGLYWWSIAFAVGTSIALMMFTRTVHPPAGSNPVILFLSEPTWSFLLFPTLVGALVLVSVALVYSNATSAGKYPKYW